MTLYSCAAEIEFGSPDPVMPLLKPRRLPGALCRGGNAYIVGFVKFIDMFRLLILHVACEDTGDFVGKPISAITYLLASFRKRLVTVCLLFSPLGI